MMPSAQVLQPQRELKVPLFEGLDPRDRDAIFAAGTVRLFPANTTIFTQGTPATRLYLLISGRARLFNTTAEGRKLLLFWLTPGEALGGAALMPKPIVYMLSGETAKECRVLIWERATIRGFLEKCPQIVQNALNIAREYLGWYMDAHVALTTQSARERLAQVLIGLARSVGEAVPEGIRIDITNEDLASAANITPYTTSRLMSEWQKSRAITKHRGKVVLRLPQRLLLHTV